MVTRSLIIFDGECGLCNGFIAWLIVRDRAGVFAIAGSAGEIGRHALDLSGVAPGATRSTIVLITQAGAATHSTAVLRILAGLAFPWRLALVGFAVPRPMRDAVYRFVAARRTRVAALDPSCGVPPLRLVELWRSRLARPDEVGL